VLKEKGMKNYYRIMLGSKSRHAEECHKGNFIGADFDIDIDLTGKLSENLRTFNQQFTPIFLEDHPDKTKISAGLACGALWTIAKGILKGDLVLCPNGTGNYFVGDVIGDYFYRPGEILPHRRTVQWYPKTIARADMSQALQNSTGAIGTVSTITKFADEIEKLLAGNTPASLIATDKTVEDASVFALEEHLEEFLIQNWKNTNFGKKYDIFTEDGELAGQQYPSDTGPIDILAVSKDKKELLVIELKKGRASDNVVGQIQRYMGFALEELAEEGQTVKGVIIALEDDIRIRRALAVTQNIEFYRYEVSFKLFKA
jgi:restriction system protein